MTLFIDSVDMNAVTYTLSNKKEVVVQKIYRVDPHQSHEILSFFEQSNILKSTSEIDQVIVNAGPGSFTGTRIGIAHAQALSMALGVPVKIIENEKFKKLVPEKTQQ